MTSERSGSIAATSALPAANKVGELALLVAFWTYRPDLVVVARMAADAVAVWVTAKNPSADAQVRIRSTNISIIQILAAATRC